MAKHKGGAGGKGGGSGAVLSDQQERVAQGVASGLSWTEAMLRAGYAESYSTTRQLELSGNVGVQRRVNALRERAAAPVIGDLQAQIERNRQTLARLAQNPVSSPAWSQAVVSAVRALNEMIPGALAPTRQDTRVMGDVRITVRRESVSVAGPKAETAPDVQPAAIEGSMGETGQEA